MTIEIIDPRVLTIAQPWAAAIASASCDFKSVENRTWLTSWRGTLFVHAGARWSQRGAADPRVRRLLDAGVLAPAVTGIVVVARLDDVHPDRGCCRPWGETLTCDRCSRPRRLPACVADPLDGLDPADECRCLDLPPEEGARRGRRPATVYHWQLRDRVVLPEPVPYVGHQGIRAPSRDVAAAVADALAAVPR